MIDNWHWLWHCYLVLKASGYPSIYSKLKDIILKFQFQKKITNIEIIEKTAIVIVKVRFKVNVKLSKNEEMLTANGNLILERKLEVLH